jgi:hypothetical protein
LTHIRTQVRNSVKAKLASAIGELHVHNASRLVRGFQADNFPLVLVAVTETLVPSNEPPGNRTVERQMSVVLKISERTAFDDTEARIDEMCTKIEKAMASPKGMAFGKVWGWTVGGVSAPDLEPLSDDMILMSVTMPITFSLQTTDTDPENNVNQ